MAKTQNTDAAKEFEEFETKGKKKTVVFLGMIRADYGAYDEGDTAELDAAIADALIKEGMAKTTTEKKADKPAEDEF